MPKSQKKLPNEYPHFSIRLSEEQKNSLNDLIEDIRIALNKQLAPTDKLWMKNDVVYEALMLGLPLLRKSQSKRG